MDLAKQLHAPFTNLQLLCDAAKRVKWNGVLPYRPIDQAGVGLHSTHLQALVDGWLRLRKTPPVPIKQTLRCPALVKKEPRSNKTIDAQCVYVCDGHHPGQLIAPINEDTLRWVCCCPFFLCCNRFSEPSLYLLSGGARGAPARCELQNLSSNSLRSFRKTNLHRHGMANRARKGATLLMLPAVRVRPRVCVCSWVKVNQTHGCSFN